ncbi:MAG TPA: FtsX-like permease family protein [Anaerolineales bacterium]|nr:FtsX-like permease family protein [Anaerolineales bacterium]
MQTGYYTYGTGVLWTGVLWTDFSPTLFRAGLRYLVRRPWQSVLMIVGIMLGVAVVVAIDLANASASRAFDLSTDAIAGRATHQITDGSQGIDETLYVELRRAGLDIPLAPIVTNYVVSPELGNVPIQLLGVDPFAETPFRSYLAGPQGGAPADVLTAFFTHPGAVLVSVDLAERYGLASNVPLTLEFSGYTQLAFVAGLLAPTDNLSRRALNGILLTDIATAQELTGQIGKLSSIDLILPEGDSTSLTKIENLLPTGVQIQEVAARAGTVEEMTSAFRLNLTALSLLALIVGLFLIYNTMTFSVVKRRPLFGILRCLGVTRREVFALVVGEAVVVGIIGAGLGVALGVVLGQGAVQLVTQTINDLYFVVTVRGVDVPVSSLAKGFSLGVISTILTAAFPAWEAASVPPHAALSRSGLEAKAERAVSLVAVAGLVLIIAGALLLWFPNGNLIIGFAGTFAVVIGFAMLTPIVTRGLMRSAIPVTSRVGGILGRMAPRNVANSLSRTSIAVAALMVAVSVTIGISLMVGSFRYTVVAWLSQSLQGDVYLSPPSTGAVQSTNVISPEVLETLRDWPGVARMDTIRIVQVESPDAGGPVQLGATDNPDTAVERIFKESIGTPEEVWAAMEAGAVIISEPLANRMEGNGTRKNPEEQGFIFLDDITLETPAGPRDFPVVGIYYDYSSSTGVMLMHQPVYHEYWDDPAINAIALRLEPGIDPDQIIVELEVALTPIQGLDIRPNRALRDEALVVFDRTFAITGALQLLTTLVAFVGVLSALLSLQLEKARELGILRAIGLTVEQLRRLVLLETGLMGAVAGFLAMPTGFVLSLILIYIINRRAFGWTLQLQLEWLPFVEALVVAVLAALLAGVYPARRIGEMAAAEALRGE